MEPDKADGPVNNSVARPNPQPKQPIISLEETNIEMSSPIVR